MVEHYTLLRQLARQAIFDVLNDLFKKIKKISKEKVLEKNIDHKLVFANRNIQK